jgi:hypothetical protein
MSALRETGAAHGVGRHLPRMHAQGRPRHANGGTGRGRPAGNQNHPAAAHARRNRGVVSSTGNPRMSRPRRHGRGVQGPAAALEPHRRAQNPGPGKGPGRAIRRTVHARSPGPGTVESPEHRHRPRLRRSGRALLSGDGICGRPESAPVAAERQDGAGTRR